MPISPNTRFIGIDSTLVPLPKLRSTEINAQTDSYTLSEIVSAGRIAVAKVLTVAGWVADGGIFKQTLTDARINSTSYVAVIPSNADVAIVKAAEVLPENNSIDGGVEVFSTTTPLANINVTLIIFI